MFRVISFILLLFIGIAQAADSVPAVPDLTPPPEKTIIIPATPASTPAAAPAAKPADSTVVVQANAKFTEGKEYKVLPPSAAMSPTAKALLETHQGKVEVIDFFSYGCPVCNRLEPSINRWNNGKKDTKIMVLVDVPVDWNHPGWENLARAFYIADSLNALDKMQPALFAAIHQQGKNFKNKADLEEFFLAQGGVSRQQFEDTFDSFNVRRRMKQGELLLNEYGVMAIPAFVINGKYYVDVQTAGGMDKVLDVVDFLVNKESFSKGTSDIDFSDVTSKAAAVPVEIAPKETLAPSTPAQ